MHGQVIDASPVEPAKFVWVKQKAAPKAYRTALDALLPALVEIVKLHPGAHPDEIRLDLERVIARARRQVKPARLGGKAPTQNTSRTFDERH